MNLNQKFQNKLHCICNEDVVFEIIEDIECDWGTHLVIQCPKCEELFSADCECPAFGNILNYPCELFLYISSLSIHQGMAFAREWFQSKDGRHVSIRDYSLNAIVKALNI